MIKVTVFYPYGESKRFDMDYYVNRHMPLVQEKVGNALKGMAVEQGMAGPEPGSSPTYIAMGHLYFDSVEDFQANFGPHQEEIMADIPNYTDIHPLIQISEVKM